MTCHQPYKTHNHHFPAYILCPATILLALTRVADNTSIIFHTFAQKVCAPILWWTTSANSHPTPQQMKPQDAVPVHYYIGRATHCIALYRIILLMEIPNTHPAHKPAATRKTAVWKINPGLSIIFLSVIKFLVRGPNILKYHITSSCSLQVNLLKDKHVLTEFQFNICSFRLSLFVFQVPDWFAVQLIFSQVLFTIFIACLVIISIYPWIKLNSLKSELFGRFSEFTFFCTGIFEFEPFVNSWIPRRNIPLRSSLMSKNPLVTNINCILSSSNEMTTPSRRITIN